MKHLLSIQGGGIRGIIPCCALVELEKQTGRLTRECFDWVAGTSTGALLTATVAAGVPAAAALSMYIKRGPAIFDPLDYITRKYMLFTHGHQFNNHILNQELTVALGPAAAAWRMNDCPLNVLITAGDMFGDPWYFVKDSSFNSRRTGAASLVDVATASACATTYHQAWQIPDFGYFFDGGTVSLADPVYELCVEAFFYGGVSPADVSVVSLGTGFYRPPVIPAPPDDLMSGVSWVTSALVGSSKTMAARQVQLHWPGILRVFNPALDANIDEADVDRIQDLVQLGQEAAFKIDWRQLLGL